MLRGADPESNVI